MHTKVESPQKTWEASITARSGILRRKCACGGGPSLSGDCDECRDEKSVLRRRSQDVAPSVVPSIVFQVLGSSGQSLDRSTRTFMESRFGHDFSNVRVHADALAASSAGAVGALAYTVGHDVVFGPGQYAPQTGDGRKLLAHELAHVVQQQQTPLAAAPQFDLEIGSPGDHFEQEADRLAEQVMRAPLSTTDTPHEPVPAEDTGRPNDIESGFRHDFSRVRVQAGAKSGQTALHRFAHAPILQRKLIIEEDARATGPTLESTLTRLVGRPLVKSDQGVTLSPAKPSGGSRVIESYIERAIKSNQTYRLRWRTTAAGAGQKPAQPAAPAPAQPAQPAPQATPVQPGTVEQINGEIVITIDGSMLRERLFTADEILAEQIVAAVVKFDPSTKIAPKPARTQPHDVPFPDVAEDVLLTTPTEPRELHERLSRLEGFAKERLTHLSPTQLQLLLWAGQMARVVPLTEVIRGVETNTPFRVNQESAGERVTVTYVDPRLLPRDADPLRLSALFQNITRIVTFIPGKDDAAGPPVDLPQMNSACSAAQQRDQNNSCCTTDMLSEFGGHLVTARAAILATIQRLRGKERINCDLEKHFGDLDAEGIDHVVSMLQAAEGELYMSRHGWQCRPRGSGFLFCDKNEWSPQDQVGGAVVRMTRNVVICTSRSAPFTKWTTVLHEIMHRVGIHGEEIYRHQAGYPSKNPLRNADSYAGLVDDLGDSDWKPCRPTVFAAKGFGGVSGESRLVMGVRLEFMPTGPALHVVDLVLGANFLWSPKWGVLGGEDEQKKVKSQGYAGGELGARLTLPNKYGSLMFDATAGLGLRGNFDDVAPAASARVGAHWRFGKGPSGFEAGADAMRLWNLSGEKQGEWVLGISLGYRGGRAGARKSEGWQK